MPFSPFSLIAFALALAPGVVAWWTGRTVLARVEDPVLPEILFERRRRLTGFTLGGGLALALLFVDDSLWALPLLWLGLLLASFPLRRKLFGEQLSALAFLRYAFFSTVGQVGLWFLAAAGPAVALGLVVALAPNDHAAALRIAIGAGVTFAVIIFVWRHYYTQVFVAVHQGGPLRDSVRPELMARLDAVLDRAAPSLARRPAVYRYGAPGAYVMNAVAIPSRSHPGIAMGNTLLATLSDDEITAIFAHEVAHHEQFNSRRWRRARWMSFVLIAIVAVLPALLLVSAPSLALAFTWGMPVIVIATLGTRATRRQDETASDLRAAALTGSVEPIVSALTKLHVYSRVPRRWPYAIERAATHPSLARRIQALRETSEAIAHPAAQVATPLTAVRCMAEGVIVGFDRERAYWFDGVPVGTTLELHALRDAASSYRAISYGDLTELRVAISEGGRFIDATDRDGRSWRVPIVPNDVPMVQEALDRIDVKLGRRKPVSAATGTASIRWLTFGLLVMLMAAGELGIALIPILFVLLFPAWSAAVAATTAIAIARVLLGARLITWADPLHQIALLLALCLATVLAVQTWHRVRGDASRGNTRRLSREAWITAGVLYAVGALMLLTLSPVLITRPSSVVSHPIAIVLFMALLGAGAALWTIPNRWLRMVACLTTIVALAGGTIVSGDGWLLRRTAPLRWSSPHLTAIGAVRINGGGLALTASPNGRAFAVTQYPIGRRAQLPTSRYVIGQFGDSAQATRTSTATKIAFIDDETLLALDSAGHDSLELRAERVGAVARGAVRVLWRERIAGMDSPQLLLDRAHRAWLVVGHGDGDESFVVVSDTLGGVHAHVRRLKGNAPGDVGEIMTQPLTAFADGSALWTSLTHFRGAADGLTPVLLAASLSPRWELRGIDDAGERFLADVEGYPTCAIELDSLGTLCVERSPNGSHVWRARSARSVERIADLPPTLDLVHAEGGDRVAAAERFGQRMMVVDVRTRQAFRLTLPGSSDRLLARWTADVAARSGYVLVLTTSRDGAVVTRYAIR